MLGPKPWAGGTESQVEHWPRDATTVQTQMGRTGNDTQGRNGRWLTGTRNAATRYAWSVTSITGVERDHRAEDRVPE